jgi:hypothetical protein
MLDEHRCGPRRTRTRTIAWKDERNAHNYAEHLDFARRATERQADRMLRIMPIFPDAPEIIVSHGDLWIPDQRIAYANEHVLAEELRRFGGGLDGHKEASRVEVKRPQTPTCQTCKTNTCGPNVTSALMRAVTRTKAAFRKWQDTEKEHATGACSALTSLRGLTDGEPPLGALAWDIRKFYDKNWIATNYYDADCAGNKCFETVMVNDQCHYAGSVNYVIYGVMCYLCELSEDDMLEWIRKYKGDHRPYLRNPITGTPFGPPLYDGKEKDDWRKHVSGPSGNFEASQAWSKAGYHGWPGIAGPQGDRPLCANKCERPYPPVLAVGDWELRVRWLWLKPHIGGESVEDATI